MSKKNSKKAAKPMAFQLPGQTQKLNQSQVLVALKALFAKNPYAAINQIRVLQGQYPQAEGIQSTYYQYLCDLELKRELLEATAARLSNKPRDSIALSFRAHGLRLSGRVEEAIEVLNKLLKLNPSDPVALNSLGTALKELGNFEQASALFQRVIKIDPRYGKAYWNQSDLYSEPVAAEQALNRIEDQLNSGKLPEQQKHYLHFSAYRMLDKAGQYDKAFPHLVAGNRQKRTLIDYRVEQDLKIDDDIRTMFSEEFIGSKIGISDSDYAPIFVFGMPRSGTTLVEQILASHSSVKGGNELSALADATGEAQRKYRIAGSFPDWLSQLPNSGWSDIASGYENLTTAIKGNATYFTDKALLNYKTVGLIRIALPNAKLIQIDRNPLDLCFGCYRQLFNQGLKFSYDFDELAKIYSSCQKLMAHWDQVLPGFVLRVKYEDLIEDPREQIQTILDFCGLPSEPACFAPHKTERTVRTLSATQVREPIFKSGVDRWKKYDSHLDGLKLALQKQAVNLD